ncbi:MBL fold metallo-hydrolase [Cohnella panacarvi]|uniref:MBL fold metallo-hydrolase n=1 Tax=Cohnella panacarvi TaxID=400776 RepID=UPI00047DDCED|nr:MBL fold metallo-hydrolase [Cohnella panacarvi]
MPTYRSYCLGVVQTNAYVVVNEAGTKAVVIDPGTADEALMRQLDGLKVEAILLTHAHFDHFGGVEALRKRYDCPVYLHDLEKDWLWDTDRNLSLNWPNVPEITASPPDYLLEDGQSLGLIGETFHVLHTPGHSPGSVSFLVGDFLFSGDALFRRSIGATGMPGADHGQLVRSIREKLYTLPDTVIVLPGHGSETTIGEEKRDNPFVSA